YGLDSILGGGSVSVFAGAGLLPLEDQFRAAAQTSDRTEAGRPNFAPGALAATYQRGPHYSVDQQRLFDPANAPSAISGGGYSQSPVPTSQAASQLASGGISQTSPSSSFSLLSEPAQTGSGSSSGTETAPADEQTPPWMQSSEDAASQSSAAAGVASSGEWLDRLLRGMSDAELMQEVPDEVQQRLAQRRQEIETEIQAKQTLDWIMHGGEHGTAAAPMAVGPDGESHVLVFWIDGQAFSWHEDDDGRWKIQMLVRPTDVTPEEWADAGPNLWDAAGLRDPTPVEQAAIDEMLGEQTKNARQNWLAENLPRAVYKELQRDGALIAVISGNGETLLELEQMLKDPNVSDADILKFLAKESAYNATIGTMFAGLGTVLGPVTKKLAGSAAMKRLLQKGDDVARAIVTKLDDIAQKLAKGGSGNALSKTEQEAIRKNLDDLAKLAEADNLDKAVVNDLKNAIDEMEGALKSDSPAFDGKLSGDQAAENGLSERDPQWPWRGLHGTEDHHPLMQGSSFREFWKARGFTNEEVESTTIELSADVHRAIEESNLWQTLLLGRIETREAELGRALTRDEVLEIVTDLLERFGDLFGG
ncbi:MAG TPA: hypothetical protein VND64_34325, partial [Pirellulales bacterium]|nr:hypothetical protein [Pirellulales bacterium]